MLYVPLFLQQPGNLFAHICAQVGIKQDIPCSPFSDSSFFFFLFVFFVFSLQPEKKVGNLEKKICLGLKIDTEEKLTSVSFLRL